jgi:hypothetical protein
MTVADLEQKLSIREYLEWIEYYRKPEEQPIELTQMNTDQLKAMFG